MGRINWGRVLVCGLVAGLVWTLLSSVVTVLVGSDFAAAVPGNRLSAPHGGFVALLVVVNLLEGTWAMWLYCGHPFPLWSGTEDRGGGRVFLVGHQQPD